jgi:hypothetical protein
VTYLGGLRWVNLILGLLGVASHVLEGHLLCQVQPGGPWSQMTLALCAKVDSIYC